MAEQEETVATENVVNPEDAVPAAAEPAASAPAKRQAARKTAKKTAKRKAARKKRAAPAARKHPKAGGGKIKVKVSEQTLWVLGFVVVVAVGVLLLKSAKPSVAPVTTTIAAASAGKASVEFYVMSQCPYGLQVENAVKPVLDKFGGAVDFKLDFIAGESANGGFVSLHGQNEVLGDIAQLCAAKYNKEKFMDMVVCMNKNSAGIPGNWESCAKDAGLNADAIKACYEGDEGKGLLSASIARANAAGASGSPTMFFGGKPYSGGRDELSFTRAVCNQLSGHPACANIPVCAVKADCPLKDGKVAKCVNPNSPNASCEYSDEIKFDLIVLNDKTCASCDTSGILETSRRLFPGVVVKNVDVASEEGKKLVKDLGITKVPAYLFAESVTQTSGWLDNPNMPSFFERKGAYYKLLDEVTEASHYIDEEAKKAYEQAMGLSPGDNRPQIDFFVMSYCPYGNQAEEAVEQVYDVLGDTVEYKPHYVIYENYRGGGADYCLDGGKYCSMHGVQEMNEDIREMCVNKYLGIKKYFEFVLAMNKNCSAGNADSCWQAVAKAVGVDTAKISACEKDEGLALAESEKKLNALLGVRGSPTVFIEGGKFAGVGTGAGYQTALCSMFTSKPAACGTAIAQAPAAAVPTGGCGA